MIRPWEARDLPRLAELERACFSLPWSEESLRALWENPDAVCLLWEEDGRVSGYVSARLSFGTAFVNNLGVDPARRRRGLGRALLAALEEACRRRGAAAVTLEVRVSNEPARALYEAAGYTPLGRRKNFYEHPVEDAWILEKRLDPPEHERKIP